MKKMAFITGATGNVGGAMLNSLLKKDSSDLRIVFGTRDADRAKAELDEEKVEFRYFDFKDSNSITGASTHLEIGINVRFVTHYSNSYNSL